MHGNARLSEHARRLIVERHAECKGFTLSIGQHGKITVWNDVHTIVRNWDKLENHLRDRRNDRSWAAKLTKTRLTPLV